MPIYRESEFLPIIELCDVVSYFQELYAIKYGFVRGALLLCLYRPSVVERRRSDGNNSCQDEVLKKFRVSRFRQLWPCSFFEKRICNSVKLSYNAQTVCSHAWPRRILALSGCRTRSAKHFGKSLFAYVRAMYVLVPYVHFVECLPYNILLDALEASNRLVSEDFVLLLQGVTIGTTNCTLL